MTRSKTSLALVIVVATLMLSPISSAHAESASFRGNDGSGVFAEKGLLKSWPDTGPKQLWASEGLGEGFASVSVVGGKLYTTGMKEQIGTVFAFDLSGKLVWRKEYGEVHNGSGFPGTRGTPTVDGDTVYLHTSMGKALALDAATGEVRWEVDLLATYGGKNIQFGISESPLIVGDKVIFTPGGKNASLVALNKKTGEAVWTSQGLSDTSAYCTPRLYTESKKSQIVTLVTKNLVGIDPDTGAVLWRHPAEATYDIHSTPPVFSGNLIYVSHGYDQGGYLVELSEDCPKDDGECAFSVEEKWKNKELDIHHGGAVFVDGVIYGAASKKTWYALDGTTGEILGSIPRLGKGAVIHADGLLYGYVESGEVVLVNPDPADFRVLGKLKIALGEGHHWAHPVISGGVLYIRHGDALMAFDVQGKS